MTMSRLRWRYYAYRMTTSMGFYVPISVIYLLDRGYGVTFVALLQAVFSVSLLAAEVPAGYLGDYLGRRWTLAVGSLLRVAGLLGYVVVDFGAGYLLVKVLFGVGWAFQSGTTDAWLYELLAGHGDADEFARVEGRGSTALLMTSAVGAVAGGFLYEFAPSSPFLVNATLTALGLPVLATFPAADGRRTAAQATAADQFTLREAIRTLHLQIRRPSVRWVVVYTVMLFLVFDLSRTFEQPALDAIGVPVVGMGVLYAGFKLVAAGAASTVGWVEDRLGIRRTLALAAPVLGLSYATIAVSPIAVIPVLFLYRGARAILRPIRNQYLNDQLANVGRATVLSGVSMVLLLAGVVARLIGGKIAVSTGPVAFLAGAGITLALGAGWLWVAVSPVRASAAKADSVNATVSSD